MNAFRVYAGQEFHINSVSEVLSYGQTHYLACISACTDNNMDNLEEREADTHRLELDIGVSYDFIKVNGGWVEPDENGGHETIEESFIVIGPEYADPIRTGEGFIQHMVQLCGKYNQWAVLIISAVEDTSQVTDEMLRRRSDAYKVFTDPKYIDPDHIADIGDEDAVDYDKQVHDDIQDKDLVLYQIIGEYYDSSGNVIKRLNNVSPSQIKDYFTTTAQKAGAERFTLMANMQFVGKYKPCSMHTYRIVGSHSYLTYGDQYQIMRRNRKAKHYLHATRYDFVRYRTGQINWTYNSLLENSNIPGMPTYVKGGRIINKKFPVEGKYIVREHWSKYEYEGFDNMRDAQEYVDECYKDDYDSGRHFVQLEIYDTDTQTSLVCGYDN